MQNKETHLQQMLSRLRTRFLVMFAAVGIALDEALLALETGNKGRAQAIIDGDELINAKENEIDGLALAILVRNQPVAQDLRFVVASLRMVSELERIGDEAVGIARRILQLENPLTPEMLAVLDALAVNAREMYSQAMELFKQPSADKALELSRGDHNFIEMEIEALQTIMRRLAENDDAREQVGQASCSATQSILIARALSRVCGRATNLAEQIYFIERGVNIKHMPAEEAQTA
ncbi:MAG: phosphate signaling complex protein PhoU [Desulfovibrionaceae bacterium]|nr:phosphate signaling complex protein PhoU [Desulfovibrionaceae bacterium]